MDGRSSRSCPDIRSPESRWLHRRLARLPSPGPTHSIPGIHHVVAPVCSTRGNCGRVTHRCSTGGWESQGTVRCGTQNQFTLPLPLWALGHVCQCEDTHWEKPSQSWVHLHARYQQGDLGGAHLSWAASLGTPVLGSPCPEKPPGSLQEPGLRLRIFRT